MINEITDPIPREHAACIVRAGALMKRIIKLRDSQEMMDLGGIDNAMSTGSAAASLTSRSELDRPQAIKSRVKNPC